MYCVCGAMLQCCSEITMDYSTLSIKLGGILREAQNIDYNTIVIFNCRQLDNSPPLNDLSD